ncbi:hypothetical protein [Streptomyces sp. H27-H5]|uniref:hypothetical protein n=1 Tax=Streptomyces sp. H27-H5 TaxID=2996460 RepID=UPI00226E8BAF|nr:hypothetical protein [Streptomyces sp. H27-H5]MCY0963105.1 hypothetical protein [Streptomyces sp. H27-H5]
MTAPSATPTNSLAVVDPRAQALIERIVSAVRDGHDQRIQELITAFATAAASPADLYLLRARLHTRTTQ